MSRLFPELLSLADAADKFNQPALFFAQRVKSGDLTPAGFHKGSALFSLPDLKAVAPAKGEPIDTDVLANA